MAAGGTVDWRQALGRPGLTPSNDDTLLGLLLSAHLDSRIQVAGLAPFSPRRHRWTR
ncbi:hypothetical protein M5585_25080 [Serratia ureilytica]